VVAPLWQKSGRGGQHADSRALGLPQDLAGRLAVWNQEYGEDKLPIGGGGDRDWLEHGRQLLAEVRQCLAGKFEIAVTEPWWGETPRGSGSSRANLPSAAP